MIAERTGRVIRRPAVETIVSYTGQHQGLGWAFGLNEALDQGDATVGTSSSLLPSSWQNFPAQPAEQDDQPAERKQRWFAIPRP